MTRMGWQSGREERTDGVGRGPMRGVRVNTVPLLFFQRVAEHGNRVALRAWDSTASFASIPGLPKETIHLARRRHAKYIGFAPIPTQRPPLW